MRAPQLFLPIEEVNAIIQSLRGRPEFAGVERVEAAEYEDWTGDDALSVTLVAVDDQHANWDRGRFAEALIRDAVRERGDDRFVYFRWSTVEEESQVDDEEDLLA